MIPATNSKILLTCGKHCWNEHLNEEFVNHLSMVKSATNGHEWKLAHVLIYKSRTKTGYRIKRKSKDHGYIIKRKLHEKVMQIEALTKKQQEVKVNSTRYSKR